MINLDSARHARAVKREGGRQDVIVRYGDRDFRLPPELPASVLDLLLDGDLDLAALLRAAIGVWTDAGAETADREQAGSLVIEALMSQPGLPVEVLRAVRAAMATLFGPDQWADFNALEPSLPDLTALLSGLWAEYGVSLGEAWQSSAPSESGGTTPRPTYNGTTASTPGVLGPGPATPAS